VEEAIAHWAHMWLADAAYDDAVVLGVQVALRACGSSPGGQTDGRAQRLRCVHDVFLPAALVNAAAGFDLDGV
jgi:hypothetical protein